ncbi:MAG: diguanylate cyclase [Candidatus Latescibacteria bacterium]|nr:diguanylate cyclase [Candidatus Latescibacterota bacterium]
MQYTVAAVDRLEPPAAQWERPQWERAQTLEVSHFPWEDSGHRPRTRARLLYDSHILGIIFQVEDRYIRAVAEKFQGNVCQDSCVEFFVAPLVGSNAYFNFEVNCGGTMLVRRCVPQDERRPDWQTAALTLEEGASIGMAHSLPRIVEPEMTEPTTWTLEYQVPFSLFTDYYPIDRPGPGTAWRGNFYKCGDLTSHPHWGSWAPVGTPRPNFHQPAFFQTILFS